MRSAFLLAVLMLVGCSASRHLTTGNVRPPTKPEDVKVYFKPPGAYDVIGVVQTDSNYSLRFSGQGKLDACIARAKKEAAKIGANGILLQTIGDSGSVTTTSGSAAGSGNFATGNAVGVTAGGLITECSAWAIFVTSE